MGALEQWIANSTRGIDPSRAPGMNRPGMPRPGAPGGGWGSMFGGRPELPRGGQPGGGGFMGNPDPRSEFQPANGPGGWQTRAGVSPQNFTGFTGAQTGNPTYIVDPVGSMQGFRAGPAVGPRLPGGVPMQRPTGNYR